LLEEEQGQLLLEENDDLAAPLGAGTADLALRAARAVVLEAQLGVPHRRSDETHLVGCPSADMRTQDASRPYTVTLSERLSFPTTFPFGDERTLRASALT
jgi:hypothetical protein